MTTPTRSTPPTRRVTPIRRMSTRMPGWAKLVSAVVLVLVVFFAVALVFVAMLLRALQGQVAAMLGAAQAIGEGDFTRKVPVVGRVWITTTHEAAARVLKDSAAFGLRQNGAVAGLRWWGPASVSPRSS